MRVLRAVFNKAVREGIVSQSCLLYTSGSGTGVLSIVAAKCGAEHVDAVDIDDWADANCRENIAASGVADRITPCLLYTSRCV